MQKHTCTEACITCCAVLCCAVLCCAVLCCCAVLSCLSDYQMLCASMMYASLASITGDCEPHLRCVCRAEASVTLALWFHFIAVFASILPLVFGYPRPPVLPGLKDWPPLLAIAATSYVNQICLNRGFQLEVAAKASAMNYTQVCTHVLRLPLHISYHSFDTAPPRLPSALLSMSKHNDNDATFPAVFQHVPHQSFA